MKLTDSKIRSAKPGLPVVNHPDRVRDAMRLLYRVRPEPDPVLLTWAEAESAAYRLAGLAPPDDDVRKLSGEVCSLLLKLSAAVRDARK